MMSEPSPTADERNPVDLLADEFASRIRNGESPSMEEYIDRYPQHACEIEELFPGVALLEQLSRKQESESASRPRPHQHSLPPGHRFGDIEIVRELGRGGMGIVYEAYQHSLSRAVAVKAIPTGSVHSVNRAARFQREAQAAAQLHHTNIVPVFGVGEQDGTSFYVMQLIHGQGLDAVLSELARKLRSPRGAQPPGTDDAEAPTAAMDSFSARELADVLVSGRLWDSTARTSSAGEWPQRDRNGTLPLRESLASVPSSRGPVQTSEGAGELEHRQEDRTDDRTADVAVSQTPRAGVRSSQELRDESLPPAGVRSSLLLRDLSRSSGGRIGFRGAGGAAGAARVDPALRQLGPRYWRNIARIGVQVASGLQYAHAQGTLHRDIKPANILLDTEGTAWIADFGLAKVLEQEDVTRTGDVVGTLRYMAPEQFRGETDGRSDVYNLGLTLYELLTVRPAYEETDRQRLIAQKLTPHDPPHPRRLHPGIPRDLETIVLKCLAWEPSGRYPTAGALVADLQAFLDDRPIQARRISAPERFWRWCKRNPVVAGLSTAVALLLLLQASLATMGYLREKDRAEKMAGLREAAERSATEAEQLADVQWDALNRIYETFVPERFAAPVEASANAEEESGLEAESTAPVLSPQTAAMLEEMLISFERIASIRGTDERYLEETARANRKVGDLHLRLGQYEEAALAFDRAIERYRRLEAIRGPETAISVRIARLHNGLGIAWQHRWEMEQTRQALSTALAILESAEIDRTDPAVRHETAWTHYLLGKRPRGVPPARRQDAQQPRGQGASPERTPAQPAEGGAGREALVSMAAPREPDGPPAPEMPIAARPERGRGGPGRGGDRRDMGREFRDNLASLGKAITILESLIGEYPDVPDYRFLDALCHIELSNLSNPWTSPPGAEQNLNRAIEILTRLVKENPEEPDYLYQLSEAHEQRYYRWRRDFRPLFLQEYTQQTGGWERPTDLTEIDSAEADLQQAVRLSATLTRQQPNVARYAESHQSLLFNLADVETAQGDTEEARRLLAEAEQSLQLLQTRFPQAIDSFWYAYRKSNHDLLQAHVLMHSTKGEEAVAVLQDVLERIPTVETHEGRGWRNSMQRGHQANVYNMLAAAYQKTGDAQAALEARRQAFALRQKPRERGQSPTDSAARGATN